MAGGPAEAVSKLHNNYNYLPTADCSDLDLLQISEPHSLANQVLLSRRLVFSLEPWTQDTGAVELRAHRGPICVTGGLSPGRHSDKVCSITIQQLL